MRRSSLSAAAFAAVLIACALSAPGSSAAPLVEGRTLPAPAGPAPPPSPCVSETGTWCDAVGTTCTELAGSPGTSACDERVTDQWSFNEAAYCAGCRYTFYVLVECGREMHLPLLDMEGARITVTEVLSGRPATLRCLNDAAKGNPPEVLRCVGPGGRTGYGPPYDETAAPGGSLSWGFPDCVSAPDLTCDDIPPGGGTVDRVSPGELQTMDCSVSAPNGLCGLYRVDVESGGFEWNLFANCDGSAAPQFQIFFDCAEALAAFDPRPELAIAEATATGNCPAIDVRFLVQNLGCVDYAGTVPVRIVSDCVPPVVVDVDVAGPIPANGAVEVTVPFDATCDGNVTITVDPGNVIAECTESAGVASCNQASGVRAVPIAIDCCAAVLDPRAAGDAGCPGELVTLDASASAAAPCANPLFRWLDASGGLVADWSPVPTVSVPACPDADYTLELACDGEPCVRTATASARCVRVLPDAGADVGTCPGTRVRLDAGASAITNCANAEHRWLLAGSEVRAWDPDPVLDLGPLDCAEAGTYTVEVRCAGEACVGADSVNVACTGGTAPAEVIDLRVSRRGAQLTLGWAPVPAVDGHRVLRGSIGSLWVARAYDHAADASTGAGACSEPGATFTDPDDATDGGRWYYLVVAWTSCGGDGPTGLGRIGASRPARPARIPTASCP